MFANDKAPQAAFREKATKRDGGTGKQYPFLVPFGPTLEARIRSTMQRNPVLRTPKRIGIASAKDVADGLDSNPEAAVSGGMRRRSSGADKKRLR